MKLTPLVIDVAEKVSEHPHPNCRMRRFVAEKVSEHPHPNRRMRRFVATVHNKLISDLSKECLKKGIVPDLVIPGEEVFNGTP